MGKQIISFKATFENGTVATTQAEITTNDTSASRVVGVEPCYKPPALNPSVSSTANIVADVPFQSYNNGPWIFGRGEVGYYYAKNKICSNNTPQTLTKPIIFIDGFDALDKREIPEIYTRNLAYEQSGVPRNMGIDLRDKDYDLIVLNFPVYVINGVAIDGGTDYVERNAMVLVKLIQQVNAELAAQGSTEKLVIVGPSMGGLISQYALAYMEKYKYYTQNPMWEHNTRLWLSFDAPHNGANIPIGAQEFLRFWASKGVGAAEDKWVNSINSTAARQMLLHHCDQPNDFFPINVQAHAYRGPFLVNVANNGLPGSNGFPTQLRKLAISSGSQAGALTGIANQITITTSTRVRVWGHDAAEVGVSEIRNTGSYGGSNQVFYGWKRFNSPHNSSCFGPANSVSYDTAPGGVFNTYEIIKEDGQGNSCSAYPTPFGNLPSVCPFAGLWVNTDATLINPYHCFIPTKSALGFKGYNQDLGENLSGRSLVCTNETPFDAYYAPLQNEGHISLNAGNVAWIIPELDGIKNVNTTTNLSFFEAQITKISTNSCIGAIQTYKADIPTSANTGAAYTYVWTVMNGNLQIVSGGNSQVVSVTSTTNGFGSLSVQVYTNGICYNRGVKNIEIFTGTPVFMSGYPKSILYHYDPCNLGQGNPTPAFLQFQDATSITINNVVQATTTGLVDFPNTGIYNVYASNSCGNSRTYTLNILRTNNIGECFKVVNNPKQSEITVSPNPADTYLDVANILAGSEVKIYTKMGILVHSEKSENDKIRLDISKLNTDLYILEAVLPNNVRVRKQIVKE